MISYLFLSLIKLYRYLNLIRATLQTKNNAYLSYCFGTNLNNTILFLKINNLIISKSVQIPTRGTGLTSKNYNVIITTSVNKRVK